MESIFSVASLFTAYTSLIAIVSLFQQFYDKSVPAPVRNYITSKIKQWFTKPSPKESVTLVVDHYEKDLGCYNLLYKACELYISDKLRSSATRLSGSYMNLNEPISYRIAQGEEYVETLEKDGINLLWKFICRNCSEFSDEHEYNSKDLSLSGLLNFIDGLWSSCGDERIFIFTTNQKKRLDPALLRPGRMDMHIHMSYLTMSGFKILVDNYLGVTGEHVLFNEIEKLLEPANATPVQVAEELIRSEDADVALSNVVEMLKKRLTQSREKKKGDAESKRSSKDD